MINNVTLGNIQQQVAKPALSPGQAQASFANSLKAAINNVNDHQIASDQKTEALATGQIDDLHDVMITAQKASITLETSVQMQRKVIDAYNEIMRMQV
ncbi:flagellar hook-basal body complex protein FliE [Oceanobacillus kapialis]|uniref:Flagellar hook-basal body complex protein FliE n=1 Tax=Oceanobacillus kapialis TaxID=481353 RepID=A0ABW5PYZ8_9BACI